jgi:hypothetical protein
MEGNGTTKATPKNHITEPKQRVLLRDPAMITPRFLFLNMGWSLETRDPGRRDDVCRAHCQVRDREYLVLLLVDCDSCLCRYRLLLVRGSLLHCFCARQECVARRFSPLRTVARLASWQALSGLSLYRRGL